MVNTHQDVPRRPYKNLVKPRDHQNVNHAKVTDLSRDSKLPKVVMFQNRRKHF